MSLALKRPHVFSVAAVFVFFVFTFYLSRTRSNTPPSLTILTTQAAGPLDKKIWQTAKAHVLDLDDNWKQNILGWMQTNPDWRYELLNDRGADEYVRKTFSNRQDIVSTFTTLTDNILRADLIRYLVLLGDGGVYSDIDTEALKPIEQWIPDQYRDKANVVVGLEYDTYGLGHTHALLDLELANWTLMARKGHPLLERAVKRVIKNINTLAARQNVPLQNVNASYNDVLSTTGPAVFTVATWEYLSELLNTKITWENVTRIAEPKLLGDVLIMPTVSFGNGQTHSGSRPKTDPAALVHHQFRGSWKATHPFNDDLSNPDWDAA